MSKFVYRFSQEGSTRMRVFTTLEDAITAACADHESGDAYPKVIESEQGAVLLNQDDIFNEWERRYPEEP